MSSELAGPGPDRGSTDQPSESPSRPRGSEPEEAASVPALSPTAGEQATASSHRPRRDVLRVTVAHGSLENAAYPVAVGHYHGDALVGAEGFLDWKLNGRLRERYAMRLYPGEAETAEVIPAPGGHPAGRPGHRARRNRRALAGASDQGCDAGGAAPRRRPARKQRSAG